MISDESSSDSETGRFKSQSNTQDTQNSRKKEDNLRSTGRGRGSDDRFSRDLRKRGDRDHNRFRDRPRYPRHSPDRRRHSRERSPFRPRDRHRERSRPKSKERTRARHSQERSKHRYSRERSKQREKSAERPKPPCRSRDRSKQRDVKSSSKDRQVPSKPEPKKDLRGEIVSKIPRSKSPEKSNSKVTDKTSSSPDRPKRSEVYKPPPNELTKRKSDSPIIIDEHSDASEEVQLGSYYNMIPAVVKEKEKTEESSEIDSSDDERLRAKLLNLEKELQKSKKKKHRKHKHKKRRSKSSKEKDQDNSTPVEVSSTTDIDGSKDDTSNKPIETAEVTSTQKSSQQESSEEGEISSGDEGSENFEIDSNDLRHKLRRSGPKTDASVEKPNEDMCGPALPPHMEKRSRRASPAAEGPALPPHLRRKNQGPSIPDDMRKALASGDGAAIKCDSSDEDAGIGPLPAGAEDKWSDAHQQLEERALEMKIKKLDGHTLSSKEVKSREQWMLELPEGKARYIGLEARTFRAKEGPDMSDRSSWTDTPEEKARKAAGQVKEEDADEALQREARERQIASRDYDQDQAAKKHKKKHKRDESLLELHQKKLKKKKKKEEKESDGKKERRPFSRDVDLQANRFDEAQKKSIIKKAQDLNTRFSRGEAKFL